MPSKPVLIALLALASVSVFLYWGLVLPTGAFEAGLFTAAPQDNVPAFHLVAELGMAGVTLIGVWGWWRGRRWGAPLTLFGVGTYAYSTVNALGWAVANDLALVLPLAGTFVLSVATAVVVVRGLSRPPEGP